MLFYKADAMIAWKEYYDRKCVSPLTESHGTIAIGHSFSLNFTSKQNFRIGMRSFSLVDDDVESRGNSQLILMQTNITTQSQRIVLNTSVTFRQISLKYIQSP